MNIEDFAKKLKKPVAVLGSNGFIGRNLVWHLDQCDIRPLCATRENLWDTLSEKPQTVFNCISYGANVLQDSITQIHETNYNLTLEILRLLERQGFSAYIHSGTSAEYGNRNFKIPEESDLRPNSHYAVSKAACSGLIHFMRQKGLPVCNLRLFAVYGPHDSSVKLIPQLVHYGLQGKWPNNLTYSAIVRDYIHVDDVCEAYMRAAALIERGSIFNIGTGTGISMSEIINTAAKVFNLPPHPKRDMPLRQWDVDRVVADIQRAQLILGFLPKIKFEEGLRSLAAWEGKYAEFVS